MFSKKYYSFSSLNIKLGFKKNFFLNNEFSIVLTIEIFKFFKFKSFNYFVHRRSLIIKWLPKGQFLSEIGTSIYH